MLTESRMQHQLAVARRVVEIARQHGEYSDEELQDLFLMGYLHDIGYEFAEESSDHASAGGELLRRCGFKYWQEVANHGHPDCPYSSSELDILNSADMHSSPVGESISYEERLKDIRDRYGATSSKYKNAALIISKLVELGYE